MRIVYLVLSLVGWSGLFKRLTEQLSAGRQGRCTGRTDEALRDRILTWQAVVKKTVKSV